MNENHKTNKLEQIKEVVTNILVDKRLINKYSKKDIEKAIMRSRGFDKRTVNSWFNALWNLNYLLQPEPNVYSLNFSKLVELEVPLPIQLDPKQAKLSRF